MRRAHFPKSNAPERIWAVEAPSYTDTEHDPKPEQMLDPNAKHQYLTTFPDLVDNWYYGLCWKPKRNRLDGVT